MSELVYVFGLFVVTFMAPLVVLPLCAAWTLKDAVEPVVSEGENKAQVPSASCR